MQIDHIHRRRQQTKSHARACATERAAWTATPCFESRCQPSSSHTGCLAAGAARRRVALSSHWHPWMNVFRLRRDRLPPEPKRGTPRTAQHLIANGASVLPDCSCSIAHRMSCARLLFPCRSHTFCISREKKTDLEHHITSSIHHLVCTFPLSGINHPPQAKGSSQSQAGQGSSRAGAPGPRAQGPPGAARSQGPSRYDCDCWLTLIFISSAPRPQGYALFLNAPRST